MSPTQRHQTAYQYARDFGFTYEEALALVDGKPVPDLQTPQTPAESGARFDWKGPLFAVLFCALIIFGCYAFALMDGVK
jgi:hypothetical protein